MRMTRSEEDAPLGAFMYSAHINVFGAYKSGRFHRHVGELRQEGPWLKQSIIHQGRNRVTRRVLQSIKISLSRFAVIREAQNCRPWTIWSTGIRCGTKETVIHRLIPKKKHIAARNLKIVYQVHHSKQESKKRKSKFFIATSVGTCMRSARPCLFIVWTCSLEMGFAYALLLLYYCFTERT